MPISYQSAFHSLPAELLGKRCLNAFGICNRRSLRCRRQGTDYQGQNKNHARGKSKLYGVGIARQIQPVSTMDNAGIHEW